MFQKRRAFRPVLDEALEDRTVPSSFGLGRLIGGFGGLGGFLGPGSGFGRGISSVPAQDARQVTQAFNTFQNTYSQDVRSILLPSGTTNPANNRAAFNTAVATALGTLNTSIDAAITNLPSSSTLSATIQGELLGSGANSLQTLLGAIPTPTTSTFRAVRSVTREASVYINQIDSEVTSQIRSAQAPTGSISQTTIQQDQTQIQTAFQTFEQTYLNDVQTILLPSGTTTPSTNSPAFDSAVGTAIGTLNSSIDSALSNLPSTLTATLDTTIQNDLLTGTSTTGTSLQARLAALTPPASTTGFAANFFQMLSLQTISSAQSQVSRAITTAVNQYNTSLSGTTSTS